MRIEATEAGLSQAIAGSTSPSKESADTERAKMACREFESILIYHMLSTMRRAFKTKDGSEGDFGGDIFKSMMDEQLSIALARAGGIGLSEILQRGLGIGEKGSESRSGVSRRVAALARPKSTNRIAEATSSFASHSKTRLKPYDSTIKAAARVFGLSADLIKAVIMQESGGNSRAVSERGAKGLMQLTDATAQDLGVTNPFDPVQNIFGGARLLSRLLRVFGGDLKLALASYNAGIGAVRRYGGIPPFKETQEYVQRVTRNLERLAVR